MIESKLKKYQHTFCSVVPFDAAKDKLLQMNFTSTNTTLTEEIYNDINKFSDYINTQLRHANAKYGIGGYAERRNFYGRSNMYNATESNEPRRIHLGIDIWAPAGTPVFAPFGGVVHSVGFNNQHGDYGATIILLHQLDNVPFHTLYGHVSYTDLGLREGQFFSIGEEFAHFGEPHENGNWPPHLHFQIIIDMEMKKGDYPGVCANSEREKYLRNCPDPDLILQMMKYAAS